MKIRWYLSLFFLLLSFSGSAQDASVPWFVSINIGEQHSGIRKEDYVVSNFSPLIAIEGGKYFMPGIAFRMGLKGVYYNFISDSDKHYYGYVYGDLVIDIHSLIKFRPDRIWNTQVYIGGGAVYNRYPYLNAYVGKLDYPNGRLLSACELGLTNLFRVSSWLRLGVDVCGIAGWGLYQDSVDMMPSASIEAVYLFK